jgi:hypothetical protein
MHAALRTAAVVLVALGVGTAWRAAPASAEIPTYTLTIKDHKFDKTVLEIPAGQRVKLIVHNMDSMPEEFESNSLKREKLIASGGKVTVLIGPLEPGEYEYFGEFHQDTAQGVIRVKAAETQ